MIYSGVRRIRLHRIKKITNHVSLDEMWNTIKESGFERTLIDPRNDLPFEQIQKLYLTIKNHNYQNETKKKQSVVKADKTMR